MNKIMQETTQLTLTLVIICALSAAAISVTYEKTKPIIENNKIVELKKALEEVSDAKRFEETSIQTATIKKVFKGLDKDNNLIALVLLSEKAGFQSYIKTLIGIDIDTKSISGIKVIEHLETPGLGARIEEAQFLSQFQKQGLEKQEVDAITGATISSKAVIDSVKDSSEDILNLIQEGKIEGIRLENANTTKTN